MSDFFGIPPALLIVGVCAFSLMFGFMVLSGLGGVRTPITRDPEANKTIRELMKKIFIHDMGKTYEKAGRAAGESIFEGRNFSWIILIVVFLAVVGFVAFGGLKYVGAIKTQPTTVGEKDVCLRPIGDGTWTLTKVGETVWPGDNCNGQIIPVPSPTQAPTKIPTTAPTMMIESVTISKTVTPTEVPGDQQKFVILPIMFDSQMTTQYRFQEVPGLSGHHWVDEKKCSVSDPLSFNLPTGVTTAFILFEGSRDQGMFSTAASLVNASQNTQFSVLENTFTISLCSPVGSWFSLWVND